MKIIKTAAIVFLISLNSILPQETKFFDAPFGGGGGYTPGWLIPKIDVINEKLSLLNIPGFSESGFYTSGGAGFLYIGFIQNLRLGGMGFGGSASRTSNLNNMNREAILSVGGGGLTIEYTLPWVRDFGISLGVVFGGGNMTIELYNNDGNFEWKNVWNELPSNTSNISRTLSNDFWLFSPTLNIDIPFYRFFVFRVGAGYLLSLGEEWTIENDQRLKNVPSSLNAKSFFIQTGVFIGFFSF